MIRTIASLALAVGYGMTLTSGLLLTTPVIAQDDLFSIEEPEPWVPPVPTEHDASKARDIGEGLMVIDLVEGDGAMLEPNSLAVMQYAGWLSDGTLFDSSLKPGRTAFVTGIPGRLIEGWNRGLLGMKVGGTRKLMVPAALGYGDREFGSIPANADLVFEVTLEDLITPPVFDNPDAVHETEDGATWTDLIVGEGEHVFAKDGFANCHIAVWDATGACIGSSRAGRSPITVTSDDNRYWVKYALGMRAGGRRAVEMPDPRPAPSTDPNAPAETAGEQPEPLDPEDAPRLRIVIDALEVQPPIIQTPHDPKDEMDLGDGLRAVDLKVGDGDLLPKHAIPVIHFSGWTEDGRLFDSSRKPGREPLFASPGLVIKGWELGLQDVTVGTVRKLIIPAKLGYGERGFPRFGVPENSGLIFEIEVLDFEMPLFLPAEGEEFPSLFQPVDTPLGGEPTTKPDKDNGGG